MSKLRIGYVVSHPIPYQIPLLNRWAQEPWCDLTVIFLGEDPPGGKNGYDPEFGARIEWPAQPYAFRYLVRPGQSVVRHVMTAKYDGLLVHGWAQPILWETCAAAWSVGTPYYLRGEATDLGSEWSARWKRALIRKAEACLAIGLRNRAMYERAEAKRITWVPYAVENGWWMTQAAKYQRPIPRDPKSVVLFVGKFLPKKRPGDVLEAVAQMQTRARVVMVGTGVESESLRRFAAEMPEDVTFRGFVSPSRLAELYATASVVVVPSEYEPWGLVVNEALACGCPVVASDRVGAASDLPVRTYPCGDVSALARELDEICAAPYRDYVGRRAVIERYSYSVDLQGIRETFCG